MRTLKARHINVPIVWKQFEAATAGDTKRLAARVAEHLRLGDVLLLMGNLGMGKTTFTQGLAEALGVTGEALSPTFVVAQTLKGRMPIHHLDFYRLSKRELLDIGVEDYLEGAGAIEKGVVLIEWADRFKNIWPSERLDIGFEMARGDGRRITITGVGRRFASIVEKLR